MFHIVLVAPEIPPNTGNVIRLAANTGCELHLIEPLGFAMDDKLLQRAGLDYHEHARVHRHATFDAFVQASGVAADRCFAFTTKGSSLMGAMRWKRGDAMVFGRETAGLSSDMLSRFAPEQRVRLPMRAGQRSLNLSNAVAVAVFDGWRQLGYEGGV